MLQKSAESRIDGLSEQLLHTSKSHELQLEKLDNELGSARQKLRDSQVNSSDFLGLVGLAAGI